MDSLEAYQVSREFWETDGAPRVATQNFLRQPVSRPKYTPDRQLNRIDSQHRQKSPVSDNVLILSRLISSALCCSNVSATLQLGIS